MSDRRDRVLDGSAEPIADAEKLTQGVARFAQYTSPVMLAMLASAGHDMAFAVTSQQT